MEKEKWIELWEKNYNCQGDCEGLSEFVKKVGFGKKTEAKYLSWAVAQRIFEQQGGTLETVYTEGNIVEVQQIPYKVDMTDENTKYFYNYCFFVNIKATWNGREYTEKYPIQDSSGNAIVSGFTQNDINKALQRARVKAIAIISGIGYKLYEIGDLQFDEVPTTTTPAVEQPKPTSKKKSEKVSESKAETPKAEERLTQDAKPEEPKVEPKVEEPKVEEQPKPALSKQELIDKVKDHFLSHNPEKYELIIKFAKEHSTNGKTSINTLSEEQLIELLSALDAMSE